MKKITNISMEDLQKHHLRLDLDSIKAAGYGATFAKKYLIDRYVNIDSFLTESDFDTILNGYYKG